MKNQNRRKFLQQSFAAGLGFMFLKNRTGMAAPSDRVRIAIVGINGMGTSHLKWFAALPDVEIAALCDVDSEHLAKAARLLQSLKPDQKFDTYDDFRRILDRQDIDAISCATPDHWHAQVAIMAFQAGKDVYGEKPLSYSVKEGQMMLKAQEKYGRIFQLGTQIHAGENYHRVAELIQSGLIGKVKEIELWKTGQAQPLKKSLSAVPPNLNYNFWLGPAPFETYSPEHVHFNYRYFRPYSGGVFADFWCHIADIAWWAAAPKGLKTIHAQGSKPEGDSTTPAEIFIDYEFDNLKLRWSSYAPENLPWAQNKGIGAHFIGEKGSLACDYSSKEISIGNEKLTDIESISPVLTRSEGHQQNFINAVKSRVQPESNLAYAREMTLPMHLGLISWELGRPLEWHAEREKFIHDKAANKLLFRKYRKEFDWI